jgi:hypothetical protein
MKITVTGTHGEVVVDAASGIPLEFREYEGAYATFGIVRFDLGEYRRFWGTEPEHLDILDVGWWGAGGTYEPPVWEFRKQVLIDAPELWADDVRQLLTQMCEDAIRQEESTNNERNVP